ncbi:MAG: peptidylprolyl isomerase [Gemmataceae bacterium]
MTRWISALLLGLITCSFSQGDEFRVTSLSETERQKAGLDPFYQKQCVGSDLPIYGSAKVTDHAFTEAAWIVRNMLAGRDDIKKAMNESRVHVAIMAASEYTTDIPEHAFVKTKMFWDRRARGLGATPRVPTVSCGEENLLGYPRDPYPNENIFVHEFAHAIHGTGMNRVDPTFDERLKAAFERATKSGLWKNTYAGSNRQEYWAEGTQCWFDDNAPPDALHNAIRTRVQLKEYDAGLAALCREVYGDRAWKYVRPALRTPLDRTHMPGYDAAKLPRFRWKEYPISDKPKVQIDSTLGELQFELDAKAAPEATRNFLKIALDGGYHSGQFKTANAEIADRNSGSVGIVVKPKWRELYSQELKLDPLPAKPVAPGEGMIAMVRTGEVGELVIYVGKPVPGAVNVVPFGKVVKGMDAVRKVFAMPTVNGALKEPVDIRRAIRTE